MSTIIDRLRSYFTRRREEVAESQYEAQRHGEVETPDDIRRAGGNWSTEAIVGETPSAHDEEALGFGPEESVAEEHLND